MSNFLRYLDMFLGKIAHLFFSRSVHRKNETPNGGTVIKKILLIKLWGLGNLTIIWPLVYKLKEKYKDSHITFLTFDLNRGFLEGNKCIDEIVYFRFTTNILKIACNYLSALRDFRQKRIDLVINFETFNNSSALFSFLINAPISIGINNKYEKVFYNYWIDNDPSLHISQIFSSLLRPLGLDFQYDYFPFTESKEIKGRIEGMLQDLKIDRFICLHPGTSENFKGKRWCRINFSNLADMLTQKYDCHLIFTGSEKEKIIINGIIKNIQLRERVFNFAGNLNIWEFLGLLRKTVLFISNDTGPVHLAASIGINTVVLYGPTSPRKYKPLTENNLPYWKNLECSPCVGVSRVNKKCKSRHKCLNFTPQEVFSGISKRFIL